MKKRNLFVSAVGIPSLIGMALLFSCNNTSKEGVELSISDSSSRLTVSDSIVQVYSLDEAISETGISKPRIYIQNVTSSQPISNFYYYYYFTIENGKIPTLEDYYTPNSTVTLESIGDGVYRIKYAFVGVTLQPGQILPNTSGNVVGIHYSDWSAFDKTNDFSNNRSSAFAVNYNVPVFLADGTKIFGNLPGETPDAPSDTDDAGAENIGSFSIYSEELSNISDEVDIMSGNVGSIGSTEIGAGTEVNGSVLSQNTVRLRHSAKIHGNVISGAYIEKQANVVIDGDEIENAAPDLPEMVTPVVSPGTSDIIVAPGGSREVTPGIYDELHAFAGSRLTFVGGTFVFRTFVLEPNVQVLFVTDEGESVEISVKEQCTLGNGTKMSFPEETVSPYKVKIESAQTSQLSIGTESTIFGMIYAPDAEIRIYSRTKVKGSLYGKRVVVEPQVEVCKPPTLVDLSHSKISMGPSFSPFALAYEGVVPPSATSVTVFPVTMPGQTVTVNGDSADKPVELTGDETNITISLSDSSDCGSTQYRLKIVRSGRLGVFVDPDSTYTGEAAGTSWDKAVPTIEAAVDLAASNGRPVLVKKGMYIPTKRVDPADPLSATLKIDKNVVVIFGFEGVEENGEPLGTPDDTVISGDVNQDDNNSSSWPPGGGDLQYLDDNLYHAVTIAADASIRNVTIERGNAVGTGIGCSGGGVLVEKGTSTLNFVVIRNNIAKCEGGGMYIRENGGASSIKNCLFEQNVVNEGEGGALRSDSGARLKIESSVFDGNISKSASDEEGGSAVYFDKAHVDMINLVISRNNTGSRSGAVHNAGGTLYALNCTFAFNTNNAAEGGVSIVNTDGGSSDILNCIMWNNNAKNEVSGSDFTVNYTLITNGYEGESNLDFDPEFIEPDNPKGEDDIWGSFDDGLHLSSMSYCIYSAKIEGAPDVDILSVPRRHTQCGYPSDLGGIRVSRQTRSSGDNDRPNVQRKFCRRLGGRCDIRDVPSL